MGTNAGFRRAKRLLWRPTPHFHLAKAYRRQAGNLRGCTMGDPEKEKEPHSQIDLRGN